MRAGETLAGRFQITRHAGSGGMGTVYLAHDSVSQRPVALKVLPAGELSENDVERFHREAVVLSELSHEGIVGYVAHGVAGGAPYLAMEWVEGITLAERLKQPLSEDDALTLVGSVAGALGAAHARGIIHRDVKPSNILLEKGDVARPRLVDFGIARHHEGDRALTMTGAILGTPGYMAPEQARGSAELDARADVYALGSLLFRCVAGRTPFTGAEAVAVLARTIIEDAPRLRELRPDVMPALDDLVARLLSRDPAVRLADGAAVARAIRAIAGETHDPDTEHSPASTMGHEAITSGEQRFVSAVLGSHGKRPPANAPVDLSTFASTHRARCERLADGSVLLVFTTASAPTDLAVRACHAALGLREMDPALDIAVVSGRAFVRGSVPIGDLLDGAAGRIRDLSERAIVVDDTTAELVSDRFVVERTSAGAALLRASETPHAAGRTLLGRPTPCVGRDRELAFLEGLFVESVEERAARVAIVIGPPGAGKSRVRAELASRVGEHESGPLVLVAMGDPLAGGAPLRLLGQAIRRAAGCFELPAGADQGAHVAAWLGKRLREADAAESVPLLLQAAGLGSSGAARPSLAEAPDGAMRRAWMRWLGAELEARPVVIVLDDLHWGDQPTVELVGASLRVFSAARLSVFALARPEIDQVFPKLWEDRDRQALRLGPLTKAASTALVKAVGLSVDEATMSMLVERAGGNAFFLEELIRAVAHGAGGALPDTVLAVLHSRFDSLGPELARVLRAASVFGGTFWQEGVGALVGVGGESRRLDVWIAQLAERELVERRSETSVPGARELVFRHDLVREAAYAMLTDDDRRLAHRLAAEWLEAMGAREAAVLATHYERARDEARAIRWATIDAERAVLAFDPSAIDRAERGVRLGASGVELGRLLAAQATAIERKRTDPAGALGLAQRALDVLPVAKPAWYRCAALITQITGAAQAVDAFAEATNLLVSTVPDGSDPEAEVEYVATVGETIAIAARTEQPMVIPGLIMALGPYLPRANEMAPRAAACLESVMSMGAALGGQPEAALHGSERALAHTRAAGELALEMEITVAQRLAFLGQRDEAHEIILRVRAEAERLGIRLMLAASHLASAYGREMYEESELAVNDGLVAKGLEEIAGIPSLAKRVDVVLAHAYFRLGRFGEGDVLIEGTLARTSEMSPFWARVQMIRAEGLLLRGASREALELVETMRPQVRPTPFDQDDAYFALIHAGALRASGEEGRAKDVIAEAAGRLEVIAATITTEKYREGFLAGLPAHRRVLEAAGRS